MLRPKLLQLTRPDLKRLNRSTVELIAGLINYSLYLPRFFQLIFTDLSYKKFYVVCR